MDAPGWLANGAALEKKLFQGVAPSTGMAPVADDKQASYVAGILSRLETDADFAPLAEHAVALSGFQQAIDDALGKRKEQGVAERLAYGDLDEALDAARREYNQLYARLSLIFPDDARLVESYFIRLVKRGTGSSDGVEETDDVPDDEGEG